MENVLTSLTKNVLIPFWLSEGMLAADGAILKKIYRSGTTELRILNEEMEGTTNIVKSLEESGLLIKETSKTIKNEPKERKDGFLPILLGTLAASIIRIMRNAISGRGAIRGG